MIYIVSQRESLLFLTETIFSQYSRNKSGEEEGKVGIQQLGNLHNAVRHFVALFLVSFPADVVVTKLLTDILLRPFVQPWDWLL